MALTGAGEVAWGQPARREEPRGWRTQIALNLILARTVLGFTQGSLAAAAGVSRATIAQIENTSADCRVATLTEIASALKVSPLLLMLRESEIAALTGFLQRSALDQVLGQIGPAAAETMRRLRQSGLQRDLLRVAETGIAAAEAAGFRSTGAVVGAAIGSALHPGLGTAVGTVFGALLGSPPRVGTHIVEGGEGI